MTRVTAGAIELERRIAARPEVVFSFFTDPERYRQWQGHDAELDARPGGVFRVRIGGRSGTVARGRFVEVQPPTRLVITWGWDEPPWFADAMQLPPGSSTVEIVLMPDGGATILRLRHGQLPSADSCTFHTWGWELSLDRLVTAAEGGDPGPDPFAEL